MTMTMMMKIVMVVMMIAAALVAAIVVMNDVIGLHFPLEWPLKRSPTKHTYRFDMISLYRCTIICYSSSYHSFVSSMSPIPNGCP